MGTGPAGTASMPRARERYVVAINDSGISNRIKNILSVLRLGRQLSRSPVICWTNNVFVGCEFGDLFKNDVRIVRGAAELKQILKRNTWKGYRAAETGLARARCDYVLIGSATLVTLPNEVPRNFAQRLPNAKGTNIDFEFERIPKSIQQEYCGLIDTLTPVDYIAEQVEKYGDTCDGNTVSVSVRSWVECKQRAQLFDIRDYFAVMDRMKNATFFMSCDSSEVLNEFRDRYGDRLMYYPKRTFMGDRGTVQGMQDIMIDMYLLSKNRKIVASFPSTYSEMAWWFGKCQAEVELVGVMDRYRRESRARDRKARIALVFHNLLYRGYLRLRGRMEEVMHWGVR